MPPLPGPSHHAASPRDPGRFDVIVGQAGA